MATPSIESGYKWKPAAASRAVFRPEALPEKSKDSALMTESGMNDLISRLRSQVMLDEVAVKYYETFADPDRDARWSEMFGEFPGSVQGQISFIRESLDLGLRMRSAFGASLRQITSAVGLFDGLVLQDDLAGYTLSCMAIRCKVGEDRSENRGEPNTRFDLYGLDVSYGKQVCEVVWGRDVGNAFLNTISLYDVLDGTIRSPFVAPLDPVA